MVDGRVSTNPFDDSSSSDDGEEFHDCQQVLPAVYSSTKRSAPLDFRLDSVVCEGNYLSLAWPVTQQSTAANFCRDALLIQRSCINI